MQSSVLIAFFVSAAASSVDEPNTISKVMEMVSELETKIINEGEETQHVYSEFSEWCEDKAKKLQNDIKVGKATVADLVAQIEDEVSRQEKLESKINDLAASIAVSEGELKDATTVREKERKAFEAEESELRETIDTIVRAKAILSREADKAGGAALLQGKTVTNVADALATLVKASLFETRDAAKLTALAQVATADDLDDPAEAGAPQESNYDNKSGGILEVMDNLQEKAEKELEELRAAETNSMHNYDMLKQSLDDEIRFATKDLDDAKKGMQESQESKATAEGDLKDTKKALAEDVTALEELHHECLARAQEFEDATKSRSEELKAIGEAKKILKEAFASNLNQAASFLQLKRTSRTMARSDGATSRVVHLLRDLARKQGSSSLAQLVSKVAVTIRSSESAGADPFAKVKSLITDMIASLEDDADEDAKLKAWCDKETSESTEKQEDKEAEIEKLSAKIEQMDSRRTKLRKQVAATQKGLAELAQSQEEMDKIRKEENAVYVKSKAELDKGLKGIKMALQVLRDYYDKSSSADHSAAQGTGSSIIGLLEVAESDLEKGLAEMTEEEESSSQAYTAQTKENEVETATKSQEVKHKSKSLVDLEKTLSEANSDRSGVQDELDAVNEYLAKVKKECTVMPPTYAEKKAAREAEIAGLKEAAQILEEFNP